MAKSSYPPLPILIVDDEPIALESLEFVLNADGMSNVILCQDGRKVMSVLSRRKVGVILLDLLMPFVSGEELLSMITERYPEIPVLITTGVNEIETAVRCIKSKAYDYILKPVDETQLLTSVKRAIEYREMRMEIFLLKDRMLSDEIEQPQHFSDILTHNKSMYSIFRYVEAVAPSTQSVLITGETGVGKELIAKAVHKCSGRKGDFIAVSISGLDETIFSDTLFGHTKGAFSGAEKSRKGLVNKADGGTLFLDEIGDLSHETQVKLLRLIQEREYFPLGSDIPKRSDVRIVAATNQNIRDLIKSGRFRYDLYYRLNSHHVQIPPLRERLEDLPLLVDYFMDIAATELGKKKPTPPEELTVLLSTYHFPGNIRELKAMIYDAVANHRTKMLNLQVFKDYIKNNLNDSGMSLGNVFSEESISIASWKKLPTIKQVSKMLINEALKRTNNNRSIAARLLGITRQTLVKHLRDD